MGWFGSAGALARGLFPVLAGENAHRFHSSRQLQYALLISRLLVAWGGIYKARKLVECGTDADSHEWEATTTVACAVQNFDGSNN